MNRFTREVSFDRKAPPEATTFPASLSSATPVKRWAGDEILAHSPGAVDLTRAVDGLPLLMNHDPDKPVGLVENVRLQGARLRGDLRFFDTAAGQDARTMVQQGLRGISIAYSHADDAVRRLDGDAYLITRWTLLEASIAPVAADPTVGVNRSLPSARNIQIMENQEFSSNGGNSLSRSQRRNQNDRAEDSRQAVEMEGMRVEEILAMSRAFNLSRADRERLVNGGYSISEARAEVLGMQQARSAGARPAVDMSREEASTIGMGREARDFSFCRAIAAASSGDWKNAGLERAASEAVAKRMGKDTAGVYVPLDVLASGSRAGEYLSTGAYAGASLVATNLLAGNFIEMLRNRAMVVELGATFLSGLVGNVDVPRQTVGATTTWVDETTDITETSGSFDKVSLKAKTVGTYSMISRNMLLQSTPDIEMLVRNDFVQIIALALDKAAISGSGSGAEPKGILHQDGIGSVVGGTNGAALTFDLLTDMVTQLQLGNGDTGSPAFLMNPKAVGFLSKIKTTSGAYVWARGSDTAGPVANRMDRWNGYRVAATNQVRSNLTKGTQDGSGPTKFLTEIILGNFEDVLIGEWGVLEILPNPYDSAAYKQGAVLMRVLQTCDIGIRRPASFVYFGDANVG